MSANGKVLVMPHLAQKARPVCPYCGNSEIRQARRRGIIERHLFRFFDLSPHQCPGCDKRFYAPANGTASKMETGR